MTGHTARFSANIDCSVNQKSEPLYATGLKLLFGRSDLRQLFSGNKRIRIGMTQTPNTDYADKHNIVYQEFVIQAEKPVNIFPESLEWKHDCSKAGKPCTTYTENKCQIYDRSKMMELITKAATFGLSDGKRKSDARSFIPKAGQQYEYMPTGCKVNILNITEEEIVAESMSDMFICK